MDHALAMSSLGIFNYGRHDRRNLVCLDSHICVRLASWRSKWRLPLRNEKASVKRLTGYGRAGSVVLLPVRTMAATGVAEDVGVENASSRGFTASSGSPEPLGATIRNGGVNFAIFSSGATSASLCLFTLADLQAKKVTERIPLDPALNKTGHIWHIFLEGEFNNMLYGYTFDGPFSPQDGHYFDSSLILLDPYAKAVVSRKEYGVPGPGGNCWPQMAGMIPSFQDEFDWEGDLPLSYPQRDLIIYEMHVRGFTRHDSSGTKYPGTYLGVTEKLDHLKELGVNCVELMPCHEFNELEYFSHNSATGEKRLNFWGYSTVNFFSPMTRYSSAGLENCVLDTINEFKFLVREAHKRGIEVVLDVVFNHTAEGNERGPIFSFRGLDNSVYYMIAPKGEFYNYSGCGNTFNCNHPVVRQFIVDCLRYWVIEMHVDGFRFDLASIMTRASSLWDAVNVHGNPIQGDSMTTGTPLNNPPLIEMIADDPILSKVKLIAEAWDAGGLYQVGNFSHGGVWSEWNGQYRDVVRQFIKGTDGFAGAFAKCLCGSPHLYQDGGRKPWNSINFVCAHDGFSLADLVSYNKKNNFSNGENNNDGENHNNSWNCGEEGDAASLPVKRLRKRQMRNFFLCLMVSQGVPMILMGDEYGHTKGGNNNTYCHDNHLNYFRWDHKEEASPDLFRFCRLMTHFRRYVKAKPSSFSFVRLSRPLLLVCCSAENASPSAWRTSPRRKGCNGTGSTPGSPTGRRPAASSPSRRETRPRGRCTWPSMRATCRRLRHCRSGPASGGSRWSTRPSRRPTTSSPRTSLTGMPWSAMRPTSWTPTSTPCSATPPSSSSCAPTLVSPENLVCPHLKRERQRGCRRPHPLPGQKSTEGRRRPLPRIPLGQICSMMRWSNNKHQKRHTSPQFSLFLPPSSASSRGANATNQILKS